MTDKNGRRLKVGGTPIDLSGSLEQASAYARLRDAVKEAL